MAWAVPDWTTGGAGFTQQDVGVEAVLHQSSCTHKHRDLHPQRQLSHKDDAPGDLALCMLQAWNGMFPYGEELEIRKGDGYFSLSLSSVMQILLKCIFCMFAQLPP